MKKIKLRRWVKVLLIAIVVILLGLLIFAAIKRYDDLAKECDAARGYTCTIYDMRQFSINKR